MKEAEDKGNELSLDELKEAFDIAKDAGGIGGTGNIDDGSPPIKN